ncbi:uncharacterized protein K460DRAFT_402008 [Cucurbitaria berberidis CBS 394.84]|uniref:Uncharacterized protein n=1 Tax=Cucurbitaria berberidis CBS 394.84 TaxID=1168544 RepID=A0A9P4GVY4_9PLEO|nr:uncharacterized protein K460DRAFT_402008 [Cucurbitaria berberidis CBS 394.84]KAF1852011.1 hypothetical protein K460DRAFT_402008 [Cucurbitaria berberidis CBS 394.84]
MFAVKKWLVKYCRTAAVQDSTAHISQSTQGKEEATARAVVEGCSVVVVVVGELMEAHKEAAGPDGCWMGTKGFSGGPKQLSGAQGGAKKVGARETLKGFCVLVVNLNLAFVHVLFPDRFQSTRAPAPDPTSHDQPLKHPHQPTNHLYRRAPCSRAFVQPFNQRPDFITESTINSSQAN